MKIGSGITSKEQDRTPLFLSLDNLVREYNAYECFSRFVTMRRACLRSKGPTLLMMEECRDGKNQGPFCHWFTDSTSPGPSPTTRTPVMEEAKKVNSLTV